MMYRVLRAILLLLAVAPHTVQAGALRDALQHRLEQRAADASVEEGGTREAITFPGMHTLSDIAYGTHPQQRMDIYIPQGATHAPLIVMVHGGGWRIGDKRHGNVILNKGTHYLASGAIFISVNYPMLPEATPLQQADAVAHAVAFIQQHAGDWGGNPQQLVLMGHSAGGHLVGLLGADPERVIKAGGQRWAGTVALDSGAMDVPGIMQWPHLPLYDDAFGKNPAAWEAVSPLHQLTPQATPFLLVCSSQRAASCPHHQRFARQLQSLGGTATVREEALTHAAINDTLGLPGAYTQAVDDFIHQVLGYAR